MRIGSRTKKQNRCRSRGPWAQRISKNAARRNRRPQQFRLKKLGDEVRNCHWRPTEKIEDAFFAELADSAPGLEKIPEVFGARLVDCGGSHRNNLRENVVNRLERLRELCVFYSVLFRKAGDAFRGFRGVVMEKQRSAFRCGGEHARVGRENLAAKPPQLHIADDIRPQRPHRMRESGSAKTRIKLLGDGSAANHFPPFENQRLESTFGQIKCGDQCIVAAADKHDALSERHLSSPPSNEMRQISSFSE